MEFNGIAANTGSRFVTISRKKSCAKLLLTAPAAKRYVFSHWDYLENLCQRKLYQYPNLAHEALLFVLDGLQKENWKRVLAWGGEGDFKKYLRVLSSRLIIDFKRKKFGHARQPKWLEKKSCAVWDCAYKLIVVENAFRHSSVNQLTTRFSSYNLDYIEEVVDTVIKNAARSGSIKQVRVAAEEIESVGDAPDPDEIASLQYSPESLFDTNHYILCAILSCILDPKMSAHHLADPEVQKFLPSVRSNLELQAGDYRLLRMHIIDQISVRRIAEISGLTGDPYKRFEKIYSAIRRACEIAGIAPD